VILFYSIFFLLLYTLDLIFHVLASQNYARIIAFILYIVDSSSFLQIELIELNIKQRTAHFELFLSYDRAEYY